MTNIDRKTTPQRQSPSVLHSEDEFLHAKHQGDDQPSHAVQEMGEKKTPLRKGEKSQSPSKH